VKEQKWPRASAKYLPQNLVETGLGDVDHRDLSWGLSDCRLSNRLVLLPNQRPNAVNVDGGAEVQSLAPMEVAHADLPEVTRVELVEVDSVVVLASSVTTTTRVLPVLSCKTQLRLLATETFGHAWVKGVRTYAAVTHAHVTAQNEEWGKKP
jgi:hypothetical protein